MCSLRSGGSRGAGGSLRAVDAGRGSDRADRGIHELALVADEALGRGMRGRGSAAVTVDPVVRAAVVHDLAVGSGADDSAERAGVVGVDETGGVGDQLALEAGVPVRHADGAGNELVDAHLVVGAAAIGGGHAQPVRAAQAAPGALVRQRLARAGGARHQRAVAAAGLAGRR